MNQRTRLRYKVVLCLLTLMIGFVLVAIFLFNDEGWEYNPMIPDDELIGSWKLSEVILTLRPHGLCYLASDGQLQKLSWERDADFIIVITKFLPRSRNATPPLELTGSSSQKGDEVATSRRFRLVTFYDEIRLIENFNIESARKCIRRAYVRL